MRASAEPQWNIRIDGASFMAKRQQRKTSHLPYTLSSPAGLSILMIHLQLHVLFLKVRKRMPLFMPFRLRPQPRSIGVFVLRHLHVQSLFKDGFRTQK